MARTMKFGALTGAAPRSVLLADGTEVRLSDEQAHLVGVILAEPETVSPNDAAELLGVSRPMVIRWLTAGLLADCPKGTHHRIPLASVMELKRARAEAGREALAVVAGRADDPAAARNAALARQRAAGRIARRRAG